MPWGSGFSWFPPLLFELGPTTPGCLGMLENVPQLDIFPVFRSGDGDIEITEDRVLVWITETLHQIPHTPKLEEVKLECKARSGISGFMKGGFGYGQSLLFRLERLHKRAPPQEVDGKVVDVSFWVVSVGRLFSFWSYF